MSIFALALGVFVGNFCIHGIFRKNLFKGIVVGLLAAIITIGLNALLPASIALQ